MRPYHVEKNSVHLYGTWDGSDNFLNPDPKFHKISISSPGIFYLWAYSCGPTLDLKIENGDIETEMVTIPKGESYFYHDNVIENSVIEVHQKNKNDVYQPKTVLVSRNSNSSNENYFLLYSTEIDEQTFRNYDLKEDHLKIDLTFKLQTDKNSEVSFEFKPIEFRDPKTSYDSIVYNIWFCPDVSGLALDSPLCNERLYGDRCQKSVRSLSRNEKQLVKGNFFDVTYGLYTVKVTAKIRYQYGEIKVVQPYDVGYVNVNNPIFWKIFKIFIAIEILVVVIVVGWKGYKKFKVRQENNGLELQNIENTMKGYNPLEDSDVSREVDNGASSDVSSVLSEKPKAEESECRVIEINDEE